MPCSCFLRLERLIMDDFLPPVCDEVFPIQHTSSSVSQQLELPVVRCSQYIVFTSYIYIYLLIV